MGGAYSRVEGLKKKMADTSLRKRILSSDCLWTGSVTSTLLGVSCLPACPAYFTLTSLCSCASQSLKMKQSISVLSFSLSIYIHVYTCKIHIYIIHPTGVSLENPD